MICCFFACFFGRSVNRVCYQSSRGLSGLDPKIDPFLQLFSICAFAVPQVSSKIIKVSSGRKCTRGTSTIFHLCNNSTKRHKSHVYALSSICLLASSHETAHRHFLHFMTFLPFLARKNNPVCYESSRCFSIFNIFA